MRNLLIIIFFSHAVFMSFDISAKVPQVLNTRGQSVKDETMTEFGTGYGETKEEALKEAMRDALQKIVGTYVDSDFRMKNDEIIKDQVITHSAGFIDRYKIIEEKLDGSGRGKRITIRAWVRMGEFSSKIEKIAPSQKMEMDGVLLSHDVDNKLSAEELLRKKFNDFNPIADLLQVRLVTSVRPTVCSSTGKTVSMRYVYEIRFSEKKYCREFLPRINTLFNHVASTPPRQKRVNFSVTKFNICPIRYDFQESGVWRSHAMPVYIWNGPSQYPSLGSRTGHQVTVVESMTSGGILQIKEWSLPDHLGIVLKECIERFYNEHTYANCCLTLRDIHGSSLANVSEKISIGQSLLSASCFGLDFIPLMTGNWYQNEPIMNGEKMELATGVPNRIVGYIDIPVERDLVTKIKSVEIELQASRD